MTQHNMHSVSTDPRQKLLCLDLQPLPIQRVGNAKHAQHSRGEHTNKVPPDTTLAKSVATVLTAPVDPAFNCVVTSALELERSLLDELLDCSTQQESYGGMQRSYGEAM